MNLQDNKFLISCCFLSFLALAGCGLKGELYQAPASVKGEGFIPEDNEKQTDKTTDNVEIKKSDTKAPIKSETK